MAASPLSSRLRRRAKRVERELRGWVLRRWLARTEPRVLEITAHLGAPLDELQRALAALIARDGAAAASAAARSAARVAFPLTGRPNARAALHVAMVRAPAEVDLGEALRFGEACLPEPPEPRNLHVLAVHHRRAGNHARAIALLDRIGVDAGADAHTARARSDLRFEATMELELRGVRAAVADDDDGAVRAIAARAIAAAADDRQRWTARRMMLRELEGAQGPRVRRLLRGWLDELVAADALPDGAPYELSATLFRLGQLSRARAVIERARDDNPRVDSHRRCIDSLLDLSRRGFCHAPPACHAPYTPIPGRVLYLLHRSLPHDSNGYATRTHGLLASTRGRGWDVSGVTRIGYPQDCAPFRDLPIEPMSVVDGVAYHRLPRPGWPLFGGVPMTEFLGEYTEAVVELARRERPELLHAAANNPNGLAANAAARALGIKSVYEVRGLWEVTRASREPEWMDSEHFRLMSDLELQAAREADAVVCITRALADEMVRRGVPEDKITLVPNGVDVERFVPRPRDEALAARLGLAGKRVIGYIGSLVHYEGLDLLLHAVHRLRRRGARALGVLIVGDGAALGALRALAEELDLADLVVFTGRIPHHEVEAHYSLVDIAPFPRRSLPVTEMVSPLKPLEAMAMDKLVVASSVAALAEMIEPGVNGIVFRKDDVDDLTDALARVLDDDAARPRAPRAWVAANRSWHQLSGTIDALYRRLRQGGP